MMKNRNYQNLSKKLSAKLLVFALVFVFIASSCNQTDDDVVPVIENLPSLSDALESFDEEVEYVEFSIQGDANARWGYKRWKRKPTFYTLVAALNYTGLLKTVIKEKLTVFAPDDKAFAELGLNFWNIRRSIDKETLSAILLNHVAGGFVFSNQLDCSLQTLGNTTLRVVEIDGKLVFQDDSEDITNILFTDRRALNSVFHGIDKVLLLDDPSGTIGDIAQGYAGGDPAEFTQLVAALVKANLVDAVSNPDDDLTVFAPTDAAFQELYNSLEGVDGIEDLSVDILTRVLLHHVVPGRVFSNCLESGEVMTLNESITVNAKEASLTGSIGTDNTVNLVPSLLDIKASNGVIHVIDGVLLPSNIFEPLP